MTFDVYPNQLRQSVSGLQEISSPMYGCPNFINGACFGGKQLTFPNPLRIVPGTNYVPRMSNGAEVQVILPIVNAPFRIFYAYNPLRLYKDVPQALATDDASFRGFFPNSGAGQFTYLQALQLYGSPYTLREPRKTFRLTVSTTF
jgi:outer membrane protein insertion porin family